MLLRKYPNCIEKIKLINSDLSQDEILSPEDRKKLIKDVSIVIHCAATVRFDEKLRHAFKTNVNSTKYFLTMAKEMKNLKVSVNLT